MCRYHNVQDGKNTAYGANPLYVVSVVLVKLLKSDDLAVQIAEISTLGVEASKKKIMARFDSQKDVGLSEFKVDLLCKLTYTPMKNPARGINCEHVDCFDLLFYLKSMESSMIRKWVCPLCKKYCPRLEVDEYLQQVSNENPGLEKVFFQPDASYKTEETLMFSAKKKEKENKRAFDEMIYGGGREKVRTILDMNIGDSSEKKKKEAGDRRNNRGDDFFDDDFDILSLTSDFEENSKDM